MRKKLSSSAAVIFALVLVLFASGSRAVAQQAKVLFNFPDIYGGGINPMGNLIIDASGNLYGTAADGGLRDMGTVFELTPGAGGLWTQKSLHLFGADGGDGTHPRFGLFLDTSGNLYGTTPYGGVFGDKENGGVAFELTLESDGSWAETVLHNYGSTATDGDLPWGGLISDAAGNLYGVTSQGGSSDAGTIFQLVSKPGGGATEKILVSSDEGSLSGNLIFDSSGNLYGVTAIGGAYDKGTVYELSPIAGGGWAQKVLHSFNGTDGSGPSTGLVRDSSGNLYGITGAGGTESCPYGGYGCGVVFELIQQPGGTWKEKVLYNFNSKDGWFPANSPPAFDAAGNLYGTTFYGGIHCAGSYGCGSVYELSATSSGAWTEKTLHVFNGVDGSNPYGGLVLDAAGNLYGTTYAGGSNGDGTAFEIVLSEK
jgi:uncharacterized repeat protein (TIGR03803 family)